MAETSIRLGDLIILEPNVLLSNILVTAVSWILYFRLYPKTLNDPIVRKWSQYLFFLGLSTLMGGLFGHALLHYVPSEFRAIGWVCGGVGLYFFEMGILQEANHILGWSRKWLIIPPVQLLLFFICLSIPAWFHFNLVVINISLGVLGLIFPVTISLYRRTTSRVYSRIIWAFLFAFSPGIVYLTKFSPSPWFDHRDIGHILMAIFAWLLYRGIRLRAGADTIRTSLT